MAIKIVVAIDQKDVELTGEQLGITSMDTPDQQILDAVRGVLGEQIRDQGMNYTFEVRRALNSETLYIYPKTGLGVVGTAK